MKMVLNQINVPVGQITAQHLEFARNFAAGFNHLYEKVLVEPETILCVSKPLKMLILPAAAKLDRSGKEKCQNRLQIQNLESSLQTPARRYSRR
ncbi:hypothetical protein K469DRAFT_758822 [Zopfia rhizophila CBS 207.26]|uniref:Uncharacterized protein n=1 Tax=Zopfia rhizophila CBS 207.26 TaxID=1314779 RepID=A0A6A6F0E1_9PEZI|nr:hypothetical protein K469DRAFT_758822 [Zopfia rhizophila CBS 207.26]